MRNYLPSVVSASGSESIKGLPAPALADAEEATALDAYSRVVTRAAEVVGPAVVNIDVHGKPRDSQRGRRPPGEVSGSGSGFVFASDGFILTNSHVVHGAEKIEVAFADGQRLTAQLIGDDPETDLAVIRAPANGFGDRALWRFEDPAARPVGRGDRKSVRLPIHRDRRRGERAGAVAASPLGPAHRQHHSDRCGFEPGQFGRPARLGACEVIGVNTAVILPAQGLCFAIASSTAEFVAGQLIQHGRVRRAFLGIAGQNVPIPRHLIRFHNLLGASGVLVASIEKGSPAEQAGLEMGDVLIEFAGEPLASVDDLHRLLTDRRVGLPAPLTLLRRNEKLLREIIPAESARHVAS